MAATVQKVIYFPSSDTSQTTDKEQTVRKLYRVVFALSTTPGKMPEIVEAYGATDGTTTVPGFGQQLMVGTTGYSLYVNNINPQRYNDSPNVIDVYVTYSTIAYQPNPGSKWSVDISFDGVQSEESTTRYGDGTLIVNSAGDLYDPPPKQDLYDVKVTVSFTSDTYSPMTAAGLYGKINSSAITMTVKGQSFNFPKHTLKFQNAPSSITQQGGTGQATTFTAWKVQVVLIYRPDTWDTKLPDQGLYGSDEDGNHYRFKDRFGQPYTSPRYMDGNGGELTPDTGDDDDDNSNTQVVFVEPNGKNIAADADFSPVLGGIQ